MNFTSLETAMMLSFGSAAILSAFFGVLFRHSRLWPFFLWFSMGCIGFVFLSFRFYFAAIAVWLLSTGLCASFLVRHLSTVRKTASKRNYWIIPGAFFSVGLGKALSLSLNSAAFSQSPEVLSFSLKELGLRLVQFELASYFTLGIGVLFVILGIAFLFRGDQP